jgi:hypothetical protein
MRIRRMNRTQLLSILNPEEGHTKLKNDVLLGRF